jgi:hypothetical protein
MATIPTDDPWVPIRILGLGADPQDRIEADVFLLTEDEPELLAGGTGMTLRRSERAKRLLLNDLRSDERMEWLPRRMWLSYLQVDSPAGELDYDLAVSTRSGVEPKLADTGVPAPETAPVSAGLGAGPARWPLYAGLAAGIVTVVLAWRWASRPGRRELTEQQ